MTRQDWGVLKSCLDIGNRFFIWNTIINIVYLVSPQQYTKYFHNILLVSRSEIRKNYLFKSKKVMKESSAGYELQMVLFCPINTEWHSQRFLFCCGHTYRNPGMSRCGLGTSIKHNIPSKLNTNWCFLNQWGVIEPGWARHGREV